jgi:hypothetical protein
LLVSWLSGLETLEAGLDPSIEEFVSLSSLASESREPPTFCSSASGVGPTGHCVSRAIPTTSAVSRIRRRPSVTLCGIGGGRGGRRGENDGNVGSGGVICLRKDLRWESGDNSFESRDGMTLTVFERERRIFGTDLECRRRGKEGKRRRLGRGALWGGSAGMGIDLGRRES